MNVQARLVKLGIAVLCIGGWAGCGATPAPDASNIDPCTVYDTNGDGHAATQEVKSLTQSLINDPETTAEDRVKLQQVVDMSDTDLQARLQQLGCK